MTIKSFKFGALALETPTILAPMEGVMESVMRDMLTRIGGYERCVTEFVRVSSTVLPPKVIIGSALNSNREDEQLPVLQCTFSCWVQIPS